MNKLLLVIILFVLFLLEDCEVILISWLFLFWIVQEAADNNCVYRNEIHHSVGERTQVLQDVAADPTLPRTKSVRCSVCNHGEAVFFQVSLISVRVDASSWTHHFYSLVYRTLSSLHSNRCFHLNRSYIYILIVYCISLTLFSALSVVVFFFLLLFPGI